MDSLLQAQTTSDFDTFILSIWPGEWDLSSLDPECLAALVNIKYYWYIMKKLS